MLRSHTARRATGRPTRRTRWLAAATLSLTVGALGACGDGPDLDFEGSLRLGALVPQSGGLDYLGEGQAAAIEVAIDDINNAGGVWGSEVQLTTADEGDPDSPEDATSGAQELIDAGVDAVVGPLTTEASLAVIEPIRDAGILQVSPASPGIALDDHPARELYLRTHPSDRLQGRVLAQELVADQRARVAVVARDDAYGAALSELFAEAYASDEREVVAEVAYAPDTDDFAGALADVIEAEPDAVVMISFEETADIMTALLDAGLAPAEGTGWYLVNGGLLDYSEELPEGTLEGVKATAPTAGGDRGEFHEQVDQHAGSPLAEHGYAAEAYDAVITLALGAVLANTDEPEAIRSAMIDVSRGPGTRCVSYQECLDLIHDGEDVNYEGKSGPIDLTDTGDPGQSAVGIYVYDATNAYTLNRIDVGRV